MRIQGIIWLSDVLDKLTLKHRVTAEEIEDVPARHPKFRFVEKGQRKGEDVYMALGRGGTNRQTG